MENLYNEEQKLLKKLVEAEKDKDYESATAIKRTLDRINDEMKEIEDE
ncbi:hypothetical protein [Virgibacillus kimchii]